MAEGGGQTPLGTTREPEGPITEQVLQGGYGQVPVSATRTRNQEKIAEISSLDMRVAELGSLGKNVIRGE